MSVKQAVEAIIASYGDLELVARGLVVNAAELEKFKAAPDTAEAIAVALLKKHNMTVPVVVIEEV